MPLITREYGPNAKGKKLTIKEMDDNLLYLESIATSGTAGTGGTAGTSGTSGTSGSSGTSGINGAAGTSGTSGTSGTDGTSGTSGIVPSTNSYGIFAQTVNGNTISNTTTETSVVGAGVGTLTVPVGGFTVGDSFHAKMAGHMSCNNGVTITVRIKSGSAILADSGPFSLSAATNQHWGLDLYFTIRNTGGAGTAALLSSGSFTYVKNSGNTFEGTDFSLLNSTTFDTTISNTLDVTIQWSAASSGNSIYSEQLILTKIY